MRTSRVPIAALLLVLVSILQVSTAGDLYWEGEEDAANEFLEVKKDDSSLIDHFHRVKRGLFDWWAPEDKETSTEPDESHKDEEVDVGSGSVDRSDPDAGEKTLRVTFTALEPYLKSYSDRDSADFRNLSKSLANAVDLLYETKAPGTQKTSLVRIQSLINDEFSCKVTLDIVTTGYDDTNNIENILRTYIKTYHRLGATTVNADGFSAELIDPDQPPEPSIDNVNPNANAIDSEGTDFDQRTDDFDQHNDDDGDPDQSPEVIYRNEPSPYTSSPENEPTRGDGGRASDAPPEETTSPTSAWSPTESIPEDTFDTDYTTVTPALYTAAPEVPHECDPGYISCDNTRCVEETQRCDGIQQCYDGTDEAGCPDNSCGVDDFMCHDRHCIESSRRCDGVVDCTNHEDERNCDCRADQFRCESDGRCIEERRRCDGMTECADGSDEFGCGPMCEQNQIVCPAEGTCATKCDGITECSGGEDEKNCVASSPDEGCNHLCDGICLPNDKICDHHPDCSDGSDEIDCNNCYRSTDFRCHNGDCIDHNQKCNGIDECPDGEDERNCNSTMETYDQPCGPGKFQCITSLECVSDHLKCDGQNDCIDNSDEINCPDNACPSDSFQCLTNRQCIRSDQICDGRIDCDDSTDEDSCALPSTTYRPPPPTTRNYLDSSTRTPEDRDPYQYGGRNPYDSAGSGREQDLYGQGVDNGQPGSSGRGQDPYGQRGDNGQPGSSGRGQGPYGQRGDNGQPGTSGRGSEPSGPRSPSRQPDQPRGGDGAGPITLVLMTYPTKEEIHYVTGGDVVLQCRDEGPERARVKWRKASGRIGAKWTDVRGRLELERVTEVDAGDYICEAVDYISYPGSEKRVRVIVGPPPPIQHQILSGCQPDEATCGNGQCIPKSAVCNNVQDCSDNSDEDNCHQQGLCEPNQFKCNNGKCVLKTWICDSEDDCGDNSDEENCVAPVDGRCSAVEFTCKSQNQCIPRSFLCDGQTDCFDSSDEIGCQKTYVTVPPSPSKIKLNPGDTLTLRCEATGVPVPLISWRLNWGHVPSKCTTTSVNGIGILTCNDMQYIDSGAYSCEAINNRATVFAVPDAIVVVERTDPCSTGYFNKEARTQQECIPCFCFGKSKQCRSADLFTYSLPTPLGQGGTRLIGISTTPSGDVTVDSQPISDQYYYQPLYNGATVTRSSIPSASNAHPYLTLPESNNGNQLKSYGGYIKYTISPHTRVYGYDDVAPTIVIKGRNYGHLFHVHRPTSTTNNLNVEARFTPESWSRYPDGSAPADRADIMMVLADIEKILVRADYNGAGVNITDFEMDSADNINLGHGAASLVEECTCPEGYEGLSCQKCGSGYIRKKVGPYLGDCVAEQCPAGTYGNPSRGVPCRPCPCPLTNRENQFARTCSLGPDGNVICDCFPGYEGQHCEVCASGYEGNPLLPGNSCKPKQSSNCNPIGTDTIRPPDQCVCKDNVQGRYCDQCKNETFSLSSDFREGCASCFCSGVTQQCRSSSYRRRTINVLFNTPQIVDQMKVYNSAPARLGSIRYSAPKETSLRPQLQRGDVYVENADPYSGSNVYYWSMPLSFAGDKVTAYGGNFRYVLKNVPSSVDPNYRSTAADVQLISDNRLIFHYFGNFPVSHDGILNASIPIFEKGWQRPDGNEVTRSQFLMALADVTTFLVKATYSLGPQLATPESASIDIAEPSGYGPIAHQVEQCDCPPGYIGTSCEDCMPGYTRKNMIGIYLGQCDPCDCNGKSTMCDPATGVCQDCADNTDGPRCEDCKPGYTKDSYGNCVGAAQSCSCDPRGTAAPCGPSGVCYCKQNVEGSSCDRCKAGTYGLDANNRDGCLPCFCSGATADCHEARHYVRVPIAAPVLGDNYGGFTITDLNAERVLKDNLTPTFGQSELSYVVGFTPDVDLYWSVPVFPGNRVLSYAGTISISQKFSSGSDERTDRGTDAVLDGGNIRIFWTNPNQFSSGETYSYQIPLSEESWQYLDTNTTVTHSDFMSVLSNLKRVLIRATVARHIYETVIADVSMDTALEKFDPVSTAAKGIEVCQCPEGYKGTSCESCESGYYKAQNDMCLKCPCNRHECQLDSYNQVVCNCRPPYTGADCGIIGDSTVTTQSPLPLPAESTVTITIVSPTLEIKDIGTSVTFVCRAQSRNTRGPLPISWTKRDGRLPLNRYYDDSYGQLTINNLQISDSGVYICEASDSINTAQQSITLKVPGNEMIEPVVEKINQVEKEYYVGDRVQLECLARGNPTPSISWRRSSNKPLPLTAQYYENILLIDDAQTDDSGEYSCVAQNTIGIAYGIALVNVRRRPQEPIEEKLKVSNLQPIVEEGRTITIVCTGTTDVPAGSIDWIRQDNTQFLSNVRSENGVLSVENAVPENQGVYVCNSRQSNLAPIPILLTVQVRELIPDIYNLTFSTNGSPVETLTIPTGGSGTVDCNVVGRPTPFIKWIKNEGTFGPGTSQRGNTLIISNAQQSDDGYYRCQATVNDVEVVASYIYVIIEKRERPVVQIYPEGDQPVQLGGTHELHCRVLSGTPEPELTWSRSGPRALSPSTHLISNNLLRFDNIEVNDEGEYICTAHNEAGTASASGVIKVRSPPVITIIHDGVSSGYIEVAAGEPVNVECRASGIPDPMVSISFGTKEIVPAQPRQANLRIPAADFVNDGYYTCSATSPAGFASDQFAIVLDRGDIGGFGTGNEGSGDDSINPGSNTNPDEAPVYVPKGNPTTTLECSQSGGAYIVWTRNGNQPLQRNARQFENKLIITNATLDDSGEYVCNIYNQNGEITSAAYKTLQVFSPPDITISPKIQTVQIGDSPTVECVANGDDIISITWNPVNKVPSNRVEIRGSMLIFHQIELEDAGEYICTVESRYTSSTDTAKVYVTDSRDTPREPLVYIEQPSGAFRVGENVKVQCKTRSKDVRANWIRLGTNEYVDVLEYGGGVMLSIQGVTYADSGRYRCSGRNSRDGRESFDDFILRVDPGSNFPGSGRPDDSTSIAEYTARLRDTVDLPCRYDLEPPVDIEWRREFSLLGSDIHTNQPSLHFDSISEADAGTYVCRVSNRRASVESRAILTVRGVVPMFNKRSYIGLASLEDVYLQLEIEISFKPTDGNGLLLYNAQNPTDIGDYIALQLVDQVPEFIINTGTARMTVRADRPIQLNAWHTIRITRNASKLTMVVDNTGPFTEERERLWETLEFDPNQRLYIGGVPNYENLPLELEGTSGFMGCVSMLVIGTKEKNIMLDSLEQSEISECNSCSPNLCRNNGFCQEALNERGYVCNCASGFSGPNCDLTGDACRPGICGPGKCYYIAGSYKCACPVTHTGPNCETKQSIEYPAFTGAGYVALKAPGPSRTLKMSMNIKAANPVTDGIIMYCAESNRGYGGFISLSVHNGRLEFRYDLGRGSQPIILVSNSTLENKWTNVNIARIGALVSLKIDTVHSYEQTLPHLYSQQDLPACPAIYVAGVDESVVLNKNTGVTGGFNGCIKDFTMRGRTVDIVNETILSANVHECIAYDRGDIPGDENLVACQCRNGGQCRRESEPTVCTCPSGFTGQFCDYREASSLWEPYPSDPCNPNNCKNGGICRRVPDTYANYTCDCPLGFAGSTCQMELKFNESVAFGGNGYLELPSSLLNYEDLLRDPVLIVMAIYTNHDGVLLYQREGPENYGDYILLRIERGIVVLDWDLGVGKSTIQVREVRVNDGKRHRIIAKIEPYGTASLTVDTHTVTGTSLGLNSVLNADSNIFIGGIPDHYNQGSYPGFSGCIEQVELMNSSPGINLGEQAVAGRNLQRCKTYGY